VSVPTPELSLGAQLDRETADLDQVATVLAAVAPANLAGQTVLDRFELLIGLNKRRLAAVRACAVHDRADAWRALAGARTAAAEVKQEALAFVHGALLRRSGLDHGIGAVGERLLDDLTGSTGIDRGVLLAVADAEFFKHTVSMVRGRFPDVTVWNLPILAHELGHHVAVTLDPADPAHRGLTRPVAQYVGEESLREGGDRTVTKAHLRELFADVYALYELGGAYPLNLVVLRARPDAFADHSDTHPSWSRRVHTLVAAARTLGEADHPGAAGFRAVAKTVAELWRTVCGTDVTEPERDLVRRQAGAMVDLLAEHALPRARYAMPERVMGLVVDPRQPAVAPPPDTTVADVLNAAWRWRAANWTAPGWLVDDANERALCLCRELTG
jgi:hypothetical protein